MNFFIISGAPDTGKTSILNILANELLNQKYVGSLHNILNYNQLNTPTSILPTFALNSQGKYDDISLFVEFGGKKVLFHSATDDFECIDKLKKIILLHSDLDIIITSCRDIDYPGKERTLLRSLIDPNNDFDVEVPRGKISRTNSINKASAYTWLEVTSINLYLHLLGQSPYNI
ncbi:hypothetical protein HX045_11655 [Myroides odoratimimus]|uniref:hypothetical protein n=1 Tax=Myroides odoratimimus TaxID=76832 RepID=UPI002575F3B8|nr:hypothetical protein [Myroides odoratimimus]MDM1484321.1 hypothetical protein [Myroides odoratimimus]